MEKFIYHQFLRIYKQISCNFVPLICNREENSLTALENEIGTEIVTGSLTLNQESQENPQLTQDSDVLLKDLLASPDKKKEKNSKSLKISRKPFESLQKKNKFGQDSKLSQKYVIEEFWCAAEIGDFEACKFMLEQDNGIDIEYRRRNKETVLHMVSRLGHLKLCEFLLSKGANIDARDDLGRTALHLACKFNNSRVVLLLIKYKPDINAQDVYGKTAEYYAECNNNKKILKIMNRVSTKIMLKCQDSETCTEIIQNDLSMLSQHDLYNTSLIESSLELAISDFKLIKTLGKGRFGKVFLASHIKSGQLFAIKILQKSKILSENLVNYTISEKNILSQINHPFIAKLHYAFQSDEELYLVLTYYSGGTLSDYLKKFKFFSESTVKYLVCEIILALEELHKNSIVYRDLKPDNILVDGAGHLILSDFSLSKQGITETDSTNSFCGSSAYMPPEILLQSGHNKSVDWYLLGVLIYELLSGTPPFYNPIRQNLAENILSQSIAMPENISVNCQDLITQLLKRTPSDRLGYNKGAEEIKQHPFFHDVDWKKVYLKEIAPPFIVNSPSTPLFVVNKPELPSPVSSRHKFDWTYISP